MRPFAVTTALIGLLLWPVCGEAHPFGASYYALRHEVVLGPEGLRVVVLGEVPARTVMQEFAQLFGNLEKIGVDQDRAYLKLQLDRLRRGLRLQVDGAEPVGSWEPVDNPANGRGTEDSFLYMLHFVPSAGPLASGERVEVLLTDQAYRGDPVWMSGYAAASEPAPGQQAPAWRLLSSSAEDLLGDGARLADASGNPAGWSQDPALRRLQVVFERTPQTQPEAPPPAGGCLGW